MKNRGFIRRASPIAISLASVGALPVCEYPASASGSAEANAASITVQADKPGAKISPTMWGIFLEDINFAADGGLYAELVKNRSFEFPEPMMGWTQLRPADAVGSIEILDREPFSAANPHYLRIKVDRGSLSVSNEGFRGMGIRAAESFVFSAQARTAEGRPTLRIELVASDGRTLAERRLSGFTGQWERHSATLRATATEPKARLNLHVEGPGAIDMDMVSLSPEIRLIAGTGPEPDDDNFKTMWGRLGELKVAIVDEHAHEQPGWFFRNATRYDAHDRSGPKVMTGEWAAHSEPGLINPNNRSNLECALSEAAFMTGLERDADVVVISCYAPLLAHVDAWQWTPDLIWFDNLRAYGTPSYYVQQMFSRNRGDVVLPVKVQSLDTEHCYVSAARDDQTGDIILKVVNSAPDPVEVQIDLSGIQVRSPAKAIVLTSPKLADENPFEAPRNVCPVEEIVQNVNASLKYGFRPYSLTVLRLPTESAPARRAAKVDPTEALRYERTL